ncbi:MerR family transcriptional regulator [Ponticaulis sp.]|uniref:MerR family transcriptional regulator n=1 Tax=Ponticaulis sp. TaxID=2020902 RepID=UPI000B6E9AD2|nr:MerR family transcriptional regulator [Ponticaulis sp.]MAI89163.1 MerR family transcriptional regulator [Ponticaulis sp.]OUY01159.1 MAG: MerR family transcriptional regulator [Hyphomonadaceae bacterium TMED5]|tara:strand:+ start:106230 stop:106652 length:423 start_codon:yes stop_codon:yes gene_type:complete
MKIGELAERTGLTASKIRFYERIGLLTFVDRRSNGYRTYPEEAVVVLDIITSSQRAGFSLDEIRNLVPTDFDTWEHDSLLEAIKKKVTDIQAMEKRLAKSRKQLVHLINEIEDKPDDMDCGENARRVLSTVFMKNTAAQA